MSLIQQTPQGHWKSFPDRSMSKIFANTSYATSLLCGPDTQHHQTPSMPLAGRALSSLQDGAPKFTVLCILPLKDSPHQTSVRRETVICPPFASRKGEEKLP